MFSGVFSHENQIEFLRRLYERDRLPNSLIFSGIEGVGKLLVARSFVRFVCCKGDKTSTCQCKPCKKILNNVAIDVREIWPEDGVIKIDIIRDIKKESEFEPFEFSSKFYIVNDAHLMSLEASNAFLKLLEEPASTTHFILITNSINLLLETIRSRSMVLNFAALSVEDVIDCVKTKGVAEGVSLNMAARMASGSVGHALRLLVSLKRGTAKLKDFVDVFLSDSKLKQLEFLQDNEQEVGFDQLLYNFLVLIVDALSVLEGSTRCLITKGFEELILDISRRFSKKELMNLFWLVVTSSSRLKVADDYYVIFLDLFWNAKRRMRL